MSQEHADRLQRLFKAALLHPPDERATFLAAACQGDAALLAQLEALLAADAEADADGFLGQPAPLAVAPISPESEAGTGPARNEWIGPYRLVRRIGRGGMGLVYLAQREVPFRQQVALKLLRAGMDTQEMHRRFEMERQILAALGHPHIAHLLDGGVTDDGRPYLVMEYVEGRSLNAHCDDERLSIEDRLRLFQTVCRAVHYAHQNLVLHRDLKPSNILVTTEGVVKLLDFGVAKLLNPTLVGVEQPLTRTNVRVMTPEYASPEQVRGETLTTASDVYSLGVLLYELLTGHRPYRFKSGATPEVARVVCEQEPVRPSTQVTTERTIVYHDGRTETMSAAQLAAARSASVERLRRRLQGDLDNIVLMALRKEPNRRYASAEQFAEDIERFLREEPVVAHRDSRRYRLKKFVARHRNAVWASAAFVVLLIAFGIAMSVQSARVQRHADNAEAALGRSEAVTAFLMELFEASDPYEVAGDTLTSFELLARGVERAEELSDEPDVQAEVLHVIGVVYERLSQHDQAERLLRRALALRREALGDDHADVATTMNQLAWVLRKEGNYDAAEPLMREALATRRRLLGNEHTDVATSLNDLGSLLKDQGNYDAAEPLMREALAMRRRLLGADAHQVAVSVGNLGLLLWNKGDFEEAEPLLREALAMQQARWGDDHPDTATMMANLALVLEDQGHLAEAESLYVGALALERRLLGEEHLSVAVGHNNLAGLLRNKGDYAAAEQHQRAGLAIWEKLLNANHPYVGIGKTNLARILRATGDYAAADALLHDALRIFKSQFDDDHPRVQSVCEEWTGLYEDWGRTAPACPAATAP